MALAGAQKIDKTAASKELEELVARWNTLLDALDAASSFADLQTRIQAGGTQQLTKITLSPTTDVMPDRPAV
jgi:hypothetical protein